MCIPYLANSALRPSNVRLPTIKNSVKLLAEPSATHPPSSDRKKRFMVLGESAKRFLPFAPKNKWENTSSELLTLQQGAIKIDKINNSVSH